MKHSKLLHIRICKKCGGIMRLGRTISDNGGDLIWVLRCIRCGYSISTTEPIRDLRQLSRLTMREFFDKQDTEQDKEIVRIMAGE